MHCNVRRRAMLRTVCGAGSMKRYGGRPSVCPIRLLQERAVGLLLWARRVGDIN